VGNIHSSQIRKDRLDGNLARQVAFTAHVQWAAERSDGSRMLVLPESFGPDQQIDAIKPLKAKSLGREN